MISFKRMIVRANIVMEALPYLRRFHDKIIVIKYGGAAMQDPELREGVMEDVVMLKYAGMHPIIVHGGGPEINKALNRKKIETNFIQGVRVTGGDAIKVVERVLGQKVSRQIVSLIKKHGGKAKSFYGKKGRVIKAKKLMLYDQWGHPIDLGHVGEVAGIKYRFLRKVIKKGYIPVISPIGVGPRGRLFNINADSAASAIAAFVGATKLILLTDVRGVLDKKGELISKINSKKIHQLIKKKVISGGMIPKVNCGLHALEEGVDTVHIVDGRVPHAVLLEIFTDEGIGTMVLP